MHCVFSSMRNSNVIFTRFVAHCIGLNGGWLLQAPKPFVNSCWDAKTNMLFYSLVKFYRIQKRIENNSRIFPCVWVKAYSASLQLKLTVTNSTPLPRDIWFWWLFLFRTHPRKILTMYPPSFFFLLDCRLILSLGCHFVTFYNFQGYLNQGHLNQKHLVIDGKHNLKKKYI